MKSTSTHKYRKSVHYFGLIILTFIGLISIHAHATTFDARGNQLFMNGTINSNTPTQLGRALSNHPEIEEIVMQNVPGSIDDEANLEAARMIRDRGLNTRLLSYSQVASGGTDFFIAGVQRHVANGARIGVHSWEDSEGHTGDEIPRNNPQHQLYLRYYQEMGIPADFYWYTLSAAPAESIHWMSRTEMKRYNIIQTKPIQPPKQPTEPKVVNAAACMHLFELLLLGD